MSMPDMNSWHGVIAVEGRATTDGRLITPHALLWRNFPLPVMTLRAEDHADPVLGHDRSTIAGLIHTIDREDDGTIAAAGLIDLEPGEYECGVDLNFIVSTGTMRSDTTDQTLTLDKARLMGLTVYANGKTRAAWPECRITVTANDE